MFHMSSSITFKDEICIWFIFDLFPHLTMWQKSDLLSMQPRLNVLHVWGEPSSHVRFLVLKTVCTVLQLSLVSIFSYSPNVVETSETECSLFKQSSCCWFISKNIKAKMFIFTSDFQMTGNIWLPTESFPHFVWGLEKKKRKNSLKLIKLSPRAKHCSKSHSHGLLLAYVIEPQNLANNRCGENMFNQTPTKEDPFQKG